MSKLDGGCLCGEIRYTSNAEPGMTLVCHCSHCQKQTGTSFSIIVGVPKDSFSVTGNSLSTYHDKGESGNPVDRSFCSKCGSPVFSVVAAAPDNVYIKGGTLDDRSWLKPQLNIWCSSAQPWVEMQAGVPTFDRNPG